MDVYFWCLLFGDNFYSLISKLSTVVILRALNDHLYCLVHDNRIPFLWPGTALHPSHDIPFHLLKLWSCKYPRYRTIIKVTPKVSGGIESQFWRISSFLRLVMGKSCPPGFLILRRHILSFHKCKFCHILCHLYAHILSWHFLLSHPRTTNNLNRITFENISSETFCLQIEANWHL